MGFILFLFVVGCLAIVVMTHPIESMKFVATVFGIILLGAVVSVAFVGAMGYGLMAWIGG